MPRVALVHDFLLDLRGAERVFAAICDAWPEADVFTAVYDERGHRGPLRRAPPAGLVPAAPAPDRAHVPAAAAALPARRRVARPARLRRRRLVLERVGARRAGRPRRRARLLLPQPVPLRVVRARGDARRPQRADAAGAARAARRAGASGTGSPPSGSTPTSPTRRVTAARIRRYFGRESTVLHPPVELSRFAPGPVGAHYLVLAELMAHKRIDVAIRAFNALGRPLVVVGDGPEWRRLRRLAGPTVRLTGRLSDGEVADLLRAARRRWW